MARFNLTPTSIAADAVLAFDLLNGGFKGDVVGIYNQDTLQQVFSEARPLQARPRPSSKVMDHPVETGATLSDHHVINPLQIELTLAIKPQFYSSTYQQIKAAMDNATLLSVQTKASVYANLIIQELPHTEDPETYDIIIMNLRLREVLFRAPVSITQIQNSGIPTSPADYAPADPVNNNIVRRGLQTPRVESLVTLDQTRTYPGAW